MIKPTADAVCAKLEERGIRCWIAPRDILPGADYAASIISGIDSAKIMVLIFSSHATPRNTSCVRRNAPSTVASQSSRSESKTSNQAPRSRTYISAQHWLDALTPPLEAHILKLAETVSVLLGRTPPPIAPSEPTTPPQDKTPPPITPSEPTTPPQPPRRPVTLSRKKIVLSVVIALVAVSAITAGYYSNNTTPTTSPSAAPATTAVASSGFITYQNTSLGVKFTHPKNWTVGRVPSNVSALNYYWILASRWDDNTTQMYFWRENTTPYEGKNDSDTSLNKVNYNIKMSSSGSRSLSNLTVLQNPTPVTFGGLPAYEYRYSWTPTVPNIQTMMAKQVWVTHGDGVYGIVYQGIPNYYNRSLSAADQIIGSFEFT